MGDSLMKDRLLSLLPAIYTRGEDSRDLDILLSVVGMTLDEILQKIRELPALSSPGTCPPDFLAYLGALVGADYDSLADPGPQRVRTQEAVERYRRLGTVEGLARELVRLGWQGEIRETFRDILRLDYRSRLGRLKLPGHKYNHGIYGVTGALDSPEFRDTVDRHKPAGTIVWTTEEIETGE